MGPILKRLHEKGISKSRGAMVLYKISAKEPLNSFVITIKAKPKFVTLKKSVKLIFLQEYKLKRLYYLLISKIHIIFYNLFYTKI